MNLSNTNGLIGYNSRQSNNASFGGETKWPTCQYAISYLLDYDYSYKILFLDVLFPLSVKKIIFVDADQVCKLMKKHRSFVSSQIVRVDMKELVDLPLEGAPYGYTPFCDDREDMEGFR